MFLITCLLTFFANSDDEDKVFSLLIVASLMLYPASQIHYSVMIVFPLMVIWVTFPERSSLQVNACVAGLVVTVIALVSAGWGVYVFWGYLLLWTVLVTIVALRLDMPLFKNKRLRGRNTFAPAQQDRTIL